MTGSILGIEGAVLSKKRHLSETWGGDRQSMGQLLNKSLSDGC